MCKNLPNLRYQRAKNAESLSTDNKSNIFYQEVTLLGNQ